MSKGTPKKKCRPKSWRDLVGEDKIREDPKLNLIAIAYDTLHPQGFCGNCETPLDSMEQKNCRKCTVEVDRSPMPKFVLAKLVCPKCGTVYDSDPSKPYCGNDGTKLVQKT